MNRYTWALALFAAIGLATTATAEDCGSCDSDCSDACCCDCSGFVGGLELTMLTVFANNGARADGPAPASGSDLFNRFDYNADARIWGGYKSSSGLGVVARFWQYDHGNATATTDFVDIRLTDVEVTSDFNVGQWEFTASGGTRWGYVGFQGQIMLAGLIPVPTREYFDGVGVTMGLAARRPLRGDLSLVGAVRYSALYGDVDVTFGPPAPPIATWDKAFLEMTEVQIGVEWSRYRDNGGRIFARGVWEHQTYGVDHMFTGDMALAGPTFSVGLDR